MTDSPTGRVTNLQIVLTGLAAGMLLVSLEKILQLLVMLNFLTLGLMAIALMATAFGALWPMHPWQESRLNRGRLFVTIVLLGLACQWNRDFTSMSFAGEIYYPVPMPKAGVDNILGLLGLLLLGPGIHFAFGMTLAQACRAESQRTGPIVARYLLAFAVGAVLVLLFSYLSPYLWFAAGLVVAAFALLRWQPVLPAIAVIVATASFYHLHPQRTFFLWASLLYEHSSGQFGRDVKIDFVKIWDDRCIGAVPNNMMATAECKDSSWIPSEYDYVLRSIVDAHNPPPPRYNAADEETGLPWDGWRSGLKVLDIGRSGGANARALELYSGPNLNTAIEYDAAIAEQWSHYWDDYAEGIYNRPDARVLTGDYRANMANLAAAGEQFDYVFYSGIGTKIYVHPRSYVFQEHWLLTEEGAELTFNHLLKPDGLFWLDWGSSSTKEGKWFIASFPEDVHTLTLWSVQAEFPFAGSPHTYVIASKDKARIDAIHERVKRLTGYKVIDYGPDLDFYRTTDNRPFLQNDMQALLSGLHVVLSLIWLVPLFFFKRQLKRGHGLEFRELRLYWLIGLAWGIVEANVSSMDLFVLMPFDLSNWEVQHGLFLLAAAIGAVVILTVKTPVAPVVPVGLVLLGSILPFVARGSIGGLAGAPLLGLGLGALVLGQLQRLDARRIAAALAAFCFGQGSALIFYQVPAFWIGYSGMAAVAAALLLLVVREAGRTGAPEEQPV